MTQQSGPGASGGVRVAVTIDVEFPDRPAGHDGSSAGGIDALCEVGFRTTCFVQGRWALAHPDQVRRLAAAGHLIGLHSHYHAPLPLLTGRGLRLDVARGVEALESTCGVDPRPWFRVPFGHGHANPLVRHRLSRLGFANVHWDVALFDWEADADAAVLWDRFSAGVSRVGDGVVVLAHSWAPGLPGLLRRLDAARLDAARLDAARSQGKGGGAFHLVTVDHLAGTDLRGGR